MSMNWNEFAAEVHQLAVEKGWWEPRPSFAQIVVMCHSELSEAVEEYRAGNPMVYRTCRDDAGRPICRWDIGKACPVATGEFACERQSPKPEGVAVEMGDCILRILDTLAEAGVDIDGSLFYEDVEGKDLIGTVAKCHYLISKAWTLCSASFGPKARRCVYYMLACMATILDWARQNDVDMEAVLRAKHAYNKTRPFRHGGKAL